MSYDCLSYECNSFYFIAQWSIYFRSESGTAFDNQSSSLIKLNNSTVLYLREVNKFLALVCILREYSFSRQGVIDFNFLCFREAIHKVFEVKKCTHEIYEDEGDNNDVIIDSVDEEDDEDNEDDDDDNDGEDDVDENDGNVEEQINDIRNNFGDQKRRQYIRTNEDLNRLQTLKF